MPPDKRNIRFVVTIDIEDSSVESAYSQLYDRMAESSFTDSWESTDSVFDEDGTCAGDYPEPVSVISNARAVKMMRLAALPQPGSTRSIGSTADEAIRPDADGAFDYDGEV